MSRVQKHILYVKRVVREDKVGTEPLPPDLEWQPCLTPSDVTVRCLGIAGGGEEGEGEGLVHCQEDSFTHSVSNVHTLSVVRAQYLVASSGLKMMVTSAWELGQMSPS